MAQWFVSALYIEAIFFIDQWPYTRAIIVCERLNIGLQIEIFALIIFLILDMPYPLILLDSIFSPEINAAIFDGFLDFVGGFPKMWNIFFIASADYAAFWFTNSVLNFERAFSVKIKSD